MTITSQATRVSYTCDGVTTVFAVNLQAYLATDFLVILTTPAGVETTLTLNSDYILAMSGSLTPPYWQLTSTDASPWAVGDVLQIILNPTQTQTAVFAQGQAFPSSAIQQCFDRLTQMILRLQDQVNRCLRIPDGDPALTTRLPTYALRAGEYLAFDNSGNADTIATTNALLNVSGSCPVSEVKTGLGNSAYLQGNIASAGTYLFEINVAFQCAAGAGFECNVNYSGAFSNGGAVGLGAVGSAANAGEVFNSIVPVQASATVPVTVVAGGSTNTGTQWLLIKGTLTATGPGTLAFAFGPATPGDEVTLLAGSYATLQQT